MHSLIWIVSDTEKFKTKEITPCARKISQSLTKEVSRSGKYNNYKNVFNFYNFLYVLLLSRFNKKIFIKIVF